MHISLAGYVGAMPHLPQAHPRVAGILDLVQVSCDNASSTKLGCSAMIPLQDLCRHVTSLCAFRPGALSHSPLKKVVTPSARVADVLSTSPSKLKGDVARKLTAHLITAQEEGGSLEVSTCGKPQTWMRVTKGQTPSDRAAERTLRQRTAEIQQLRQVVSCSSSASQHADELKRMAKREQDQLLKDAGLATTSARHGAALAMKCDLHLPWYRLRQLRKWLTSFGVRMESEAEMRKQISEFLLFSLLAEEVSMADKSGISLKPMVRFADLPQVVMHYSEQHQNAGTLCWHTVHSDKSEVWVKLGGDHGGGSFSYVFNWETSHTQTR